MKLKCLINEDVDNDGKILLEKDKEYEIVYWWGENPIVLIGKTEIVLRPGEWSYKK